MKDKVNVLEGDWLDADYDKVKSQLIASDISTANHITLPLTHLHNDAYWRDIDENCVASLDHRHWYYDDHIFEDYITRICSVSMKSICLFDTPYFETLLDPEMLDALLYERTEVLAVALKNYQPSTIIVSPAICVMDQPTENRFIDYLIQYRDVFDVYGMHLFHDMKGKTTGRINSVLQQSLTVSNKQVWVVKWSIPSVERRFLIDLHEPNWDQLLYREAAKKLSRAFQSVESITHGHSKWFFVVGKDTFERIDHKMRNFWGRSDRFMPVDFHDFLGVMDSQGRVKQPILDTVKLLAHE